MDKLSFYLVSFGVPLILYAVWLARFSNRLRFLGLLVVMILAVWLLQWPVHFAPQHERLSDGVDDRVDAVVTGFVLLGWLNGLIGALPVILIEISRRIVLLFRKRRRNPR
jgi:hypothetical protein